MSINQKSLFDLSVSERVLSPERSATREQRIQKIENAFAGSDDSVPYASGSETSKAAASEMSPYLGRLQACIFDFIASCHAFGATDQEVQEALGIDSSTQRPRRCELANKGLIRKAKIKRKTRSGRQAQVWIASQ